MPESGNDEQNDRAARKLANAVVSEFVNRQTPSSAGERLLQWLPLIVALSTAFWTLAIQSKQVEENSSDIAKLEMRADQEQEARREVTGRLARIETLLEIITGGKEQPYGRAPQ